MRHLTWILAFCPAVAWAQDWAPMTGDQIAATLTGAQVTYQDGSWQTFAADGTTNYNTGEDSAGTWNVQGDRYCSVWPPASDVACYDMTGNGGGRVQFIADDGTIFEGIIAE